MLFSMDLYDVIFHLGRYSVRRFSAGGVIGVWGEASWYAALYLLIAVGGGGGG